MLLNLPQKNMDGRTQRSSKRTPKPSLKILEYIESIKQFSSKGSSTPTFNYFSSDKCKLSHKLLLTDASTLKSKRPLRSREEKSSKRLKCSVSVYLLKEMKEGSTDTSTNGRDTNNLDHITVKQEQDEDYRLSPSPTTMCEPKTLGTFVEVSEGSAYCNTCPINLLTLYSLN